MESPDCATLPRLARRFARLDWMDVGCGTGALSAAVLARCDPRSLVSIDPSEGFIATASASVADRRAEFQVGDAQALALRPPAGTLSPRR